MTSYQSPPMSTSGPPGTYRAAVHQPGDVRQALGQEALLQRLRHRPLAGEEAGVLDGDGGPAGELFGQVDGRRARPRPPGPATARRASPAGPSRDDDGRVAGLVEPLGKAGSGAPPGPCGHDRPGGGADGPRGRRAAPRGPGDGGGSPADRPVGLHQVDQAGVGEGRATRRARSWRTTSRSNDDVRALVASAKRARRAPACLGRQAGRPFRLVGVPPDG